MSYDPEAAIEVLQAGLKPVKPHTFAQGDTLVGSRFVFILPFFFLSLVYFLLILLFVPLNGTYVCIARVRVGVDATWAETIPRSGGFVYPVDRIE